MLWWTLQTACVAVLLAAIVAVLCRLGRFSPAVKHALWLLVLVKLLTPPLGWYRLPRVIEERLDRWTAPAQLEDVEAAESSGRAADIVSDDALDSEMLAALPDLCRERTPCRSVGGDATSTRSSRNGTESVPYRPSRATEAFKTAGSNVAQSVQDESEFDRLASRTSHDDAPFLRDPAAADDVTARWFPRAGYLLLAGWLLGAIPLAIIESIRIARLARLVKQSSPAPAWLERLVGQVAARLGVRPPRVEVTPAACSPLVCAVGRPCLIWPAALGDQLSAEARQVVLLHELAHLRRRDHWVAWLVLAGEVVWWFNPLYWYVRHQLCENAELACDAWVVGLLPSGRRAYARALIEVTEFVSLAPAAMPAVAMGNVARHTLERRLIMILRESTSYRVSWAGMGLIGLSLLVVLPSFSGGQDGNPNDIGRSASTALPGTQGPVETQEQAETPEPAATRAPAALVAPASAGESVPPSATAASAQAGAQDLAFPVAGQANPAAPGGPAVAQSANATPPAQPAANEADRIQTLENQLHQLLDEVKALRAGSPGSPQANNSQKDMQQIYVSQLARTARALNANNRYRTFAGISQERAEANQGHHSYEEETLTRAKYRLPEATAQALAQFIGEHVKNDVEARVSGDTLTVIAAQEDQARINAFIGLLREATPPPAGAPVGPQQKTSSTFEGAHGFPGALTTGRKR